MNTPTATYNRIRRSTAGVNKRYDEREYALVSFPNVNKHSIVPAASVNVDPLDKQNGSIKTFGSKKNLRIISSGSKEVMKERASRFAASAGSEEIDLVPDEGENDENEGGDDEHTSSTPRHFSKQIRKQVTTNELSKSQNESILSDNDDDLITTSNYQRSEDSSISKKTPLHNQPLNFDRVYPSTPSAKRSHDNDFNESSLSGSDATGDEHEKDLPVINKNNELRSMLKKPYRKRKKQVLDSASDENRPCAGCIENEKRIGQLEKRIDDMEKRADRMEKVLPVLKKYRQTGMPIAAANEANLRTDAGRIFDDVEKITGVTHNEITSTLSRPTLVMREILRKANRIGDKSYFKKHEDLFKNFIQVKCLIDDSQMKSVWKEIASSVGRQHLDEESNKKKKKQNSSFTDTNSTPPTSAQETVTEDQQQTTSSILTTGTATETAGSTVVATATETAGSTVATSATETAGSTTETAGSTTPTTTSDTT